MVDSLSLSAINQAVDNSLNIAHNQNTKRPTVSVSETDSSNSHGLQNENLDDSKAVSQKDYQLFEDQDKMI
mgnify:CR=1 FL=1